MLEQNRVLPSHAGTHMKSITYTDLTFVCLNIEVMYLYFEKACTKKTVASSWYKKPFVWMLAAGKLNKKHQR